MIAKELSVQLTMSRKSDAKSTRYGERIVVFRKQSVFGRTERSARGSRTRSDFRLFKAEAGPKPERPTNDCKMRRLPPELYREIIEYLNQDDILTLVLVSRTFQAEAERLLFGKIMIDSNPYDPAKRDVVKHCTRLIALPRIWPLVRWVYIRRISKGRASLEVVSRVADLLEKLTNVTKLHVRDPGNAWPLCGKLFRGCSFRLRYLSCHFLLDKDFASFLDSQPSLYEFEWAPLYDLDSRTSQRYELPPSTLPLLAIYLSVGKEIRTDDILPGRPIAHFRGYNLGRRATEVLHDLVRSIVPLKSLHIHPMDADFLCLLPVAFPFLEYLGPVNLDEPEVVSDALLHPI
jgi:hypothetical protein